MTFSLGYFLRTSDQRARAFMRVQANGFFVSYSDRPVAKWRH